MENRQYDEERLYDAVIIGGGPAGLTAAIYLARARHRVLVIEKEQLGGQITITDEVVNYPGIEQISGRALTDAMYRQAEGFGAEFLAAEVIKLDITDDVKTVHTSRGDIYCFGILIATGARPRKVGFDGEDEFRGRGVAYCATCDGEFFTGKDIFVIGGGFAAAEESVFLTKFARHVTIMIRGDDFTCAAAVAEPAKNHEKITVLTNTVAEKVSGENGINYIRYRNTRTGETTEYKADVGEDFGVFVFAGYSPDTEIVKDKIALDKGYIVTDPTQKTSADGVYAAGDVCIKPLRQVVTATGDGAIAATELEKYATAMQAKTGLHPTPPERKRATSAHQNAKDSEGDTGASSLFDRNMREQLAVVFEKTEHPLTLTLYLDNRPISEELEHFARELCSLSEKLTLTIAETGSKNTAYPCVRIFRDGEDTGIAFHGVPLGHEFTSFVLALYNASGKGQTLNTETESRIDNIKTATDMKILVSLSCTMCPDLVTACQRIASKNPSVRAEAYDIRHFDSLKSQYNVMSVPCLIINDKDVYFGKKNVEQILDLIDKQ